nr:hypothetical protein BaRGS_003948 [Batillaria attramentaria]
MKCALKLSEQEEKVVVVVGVQGEEECSLRKPVQSESDETSSLAPLVTETSSFGNPALTGIYNNDTDLWVDFFTAQFTNYRLSLPMAHLHGMDRHSTEWMNHHNRGPYLLWQQDHVESRHRITVHDERLRLKYDNRAHNRIKGIEIMETGVYLVYSKAIVEGSIRNSTGYMDHCAHETVVLDHQSLNPRVLLASYITQDES